MSSPSPAEANNNAPDEEDLQELLETMGETGVALIAVTLHLLTYVLYIAVDIDKDFALFTQSFNISMESPLSRNLKEDGQDSSDETTKQISCNDIEEEEEEGVAIATELTLDHHGKTNIHIEESPAVVDSQQHPLSSLNEMNMERIWEREEIFSSKYRPTQDELANLTRIEIDLGIQPPPLKPTIGRLGLFRGAQRAPSSKMNVVSDDLKNAWNQIAHPTDQTHPFSLVLMITSCEMVNIQINHQILEGEALETITNQTAIDNGCDLYLLTRGLALATTTATNANNNINNNTGKEKSLLLHTAIPWDHVKFIVEPTRMNQNQKNDTFTNMWTLVTHTGETFQFHNTRHVTIWFDAIRTALIRFHEHQQKTSRRGFINLGWQYTVVHRKYFTMAVTNDIDIMEEGGDPTTGKDQSIDTLDEYNGYTPMHYAARANHIPALSKLLELGANPDVPDAVDGQTPMYYCVRDGFDSAVELLLAHGAKPVSRTNDKGELFGRVAATQALLEEKSRQEERKREVEAAAAELQQNLRLMQKRGEKIDELGNKASELNQGAEDFASMAKQLKEKVKNKKWYQL
jgi:hypothetical protein